MCDNHLNIISLWSFQITVNYNKFYMIMASILIKKQPINNIGVTVNFTYLSSLEI